MIPRDLVKIMTISDICHKAIRTALTLKKPNQGLQVVTISKYLSRGSSHNAISSDTYCILEIFRAREREGGEERRREGFVDCRFAFVRPDAPAPALALSHS